MCFSAPASFVASGTLAIIGGAAVKKAKGPDKVLAFAPLIFAVQQLFEGFVWLSDKQSTTGILLGYGFLFFAYLWWPIFLPIGAYVHEQDKQRKKYMLWFIGLGIVVVAYLLAMLIVHPISIQVHDHHIAYFTGGFLPGWTAVFYMIAIAGAFLLSSSRFVQIFGVLTVVSAAVAFAITSMSFASVWCFFAAILSGIGYAHLLLKKKKH